MWIKLNKKISSEFQYQVQYSVEMFSHKSDFLEGTQFWSTKYLSL